MQLTFGPTQARSTPLWITGVLPFLVHLVLEVLEHRSEEDLDVIIREEPPWRNDKSAVPSTKASLPSIEPVPT